MTDELSSAVCSLPLAHLCLLNTTNDKQTSSNSFSVTQKALGFGLELATTHMEVKRLLLVFGSVQPPLPVGPQTNGSKAEPAPTQNS